MARLGRRRQLDTKSDYRQLLLPGIGTVDACRTVGTGRKTGYRWRVENGCLHVCGDPWPDGRERAWSPSVSSPAGAGPLSLFECRQHAPGRDGIQRAAAWQRRLDEPAHDPQTSWAGAKRLINTQAVTSITGGGHLLRDPERICGWPRAPGDRCRRLLRFLRPFRSISDLPG
jgi:hypothetical protein